MLSDVVELTQLIKTALQDKDVKLDTIVELYDNYRLLCEILDFGYSFVNGYFCMDIAKPLFQETESFLSPEVKWLYFTNRDLKIFNNSITKYIQQINKIGFSRNSYIRDILFYNLSGSSAFKLYVTQYDKIKFRECGLKLEYEHISFKVTTKGNRKYYCNQKCNLIERTKLFYIKTKDQKENIIKLLKKNFQELEKFKIYLEYYFLKHNIPKSLFKNIKKRGMSAYY